LSLVRRMGFSLHGSGDGLPGAFHHRPTWPSGDAAQHNGSVAHVIWDRIEAAPGAEMGHLMISICVEPEEKAGRPVVLVPRP
jgi:hypothetical protein